eukprot:CAMPEP_0183343964 /NCGR_PEP_ID=MMETSP0164_2-20130417/9767_1 /TAXON_ID=221442 /ORGANISM="Coccolithus pelagicus ssp braarudi, Strain PLY182g" /LENGTH=184 /DNA_ID=CAMNT_0025514895 /DNA_START=48 /DNA_END=602 /DNA_ORIENTATION=-
MKYLVAIVLFAAAVAAVTPAEQGHTIMAPGKGGDAGKGETVLHPAPAAPASTKPMTPAKIATPEHNTCGCCHLDTCACCAKKAEPQTIAPEIKEEPKPACPCHTTGICSNTCSCCEATHVTPEIKEANANQCNCCHLDTCGCCKAQETVVPEQKEAHVAPEIKEKPKCPCAAEEASCACAAKAE